ncbi:type-5 thionin-like [Hordeum vulgare subsp. vulgare]|uniref:type-5 thionin-like n=1 Tax=Hordeum vulgare subsp. vulgare TaxID=112509 RepID=UPI001D1A55EB|nr:type-5 thionin-like [Hordeum vulgare subsp. vulgare]
MGGSKRGLESAIVCLLVLGLGWVQVEGVDCGANVFKLACYNACLLGPSKVFQCANFCGCQLPAVLAFAGRSDEPNASLGCKSSVCYNMVNTATNSEEMKINVKRW